MITMGERWGRCTNSLKAARRQDRDDPGELYGTVACAAITGRCRQNRRHAAARHVVTGPVAMPLALASALPAATLSRQAATQPCRGSA